MLLPSSALTTSWPNHGSYLPPGLCLSSLHTWVHQPQWCQNELLKIAWTYLLPADMYPPVLKVQLSYRSNQVSLHSCQPHFLAFVNLRLWFFPEHAMSFHAFPSDRSILCLLISGSDWVSHLFCSVSDSVKAFPGIFTPSKNNAPFSCSSYLFWLRRPQR